jgi:hypothetical protein
MFTTDNGKELNSYYMANYRTKLLFSSFINLPAVFQIGIAVEYLNTKNIGMYIDLHNVHYFYIDPRLNVNNMLVNQAKTGKLTDIIEHISLDVPFNNIVDGYVYGITNAIKHLHEWC